MASPARHRRWIVAGGGAWLAAVVVGMSMLWRYALTPGPPAPAPRAWPAEALVARDGQRPTLVLFLHPQCSCSRATVGELAKIVTRVGDRLSVQAFVYRPESTPGAWSHTDIWESAARLPGVFVRDDPDGRTADAFGALTSGQAMLYAADGQLLYSGGITAARGHAGDNDGEKAVIASVLGQPTTRSIYPAFGCALHAPIEAPRRDDPPAS